MSHSSWGVNPGFAQLDRIRNYLTQGDIQNFTYWIFEFFEKWIIKIKDAKLILCIWYHSDKHFIFVCKSISFAGIAEQNIFFCSRSFTCSVHDQAAILDI